MLFVVKHPNMNDISFHRIRYYLQGIGVRSVTFAHYRIYPHMSLLNFQNEPRINLVLLRSHDILSSVFSFFFFAKERWNNRRIKVLFAAKSICLQMLKWNSPIDKWLILVWSINTLLRPRIISQLSSFSLSNLKNIRAWESYMHSIVLASNNGVLAIHSATGYVLLLLCSSIGSVAKEILWTLPLSGTLHIIRNTRLPLVEI